MPEPRIDLHAHTRVSDGSDTPTELINQAKHAGLDVIALTDHDTTAGWEEAQSAAQAAGVGFVPGIELSAQILDNSPESPPLSVHVLGYLVDADNPSLVDEMATIREHRNDRLRLMVERLGEDIDINFDEVAARIAPGATPGRPHIADVLVRKGIVTDVSQAFEHYLAGDGPYHVPHYAPKLSRALDVIRQAGGVPVLAHPLSGGRRYALDGSDNLEDLTSHLATLAEMGLAGVEVYHRENARHLVAMLEEATNRAGLLRTGSSDYHGTKKPNRLGENLTTRREFDKILEQATGSPAWLPENFFA